MGAPEKAERPDFNTLQIVMSHYLIAYDKPIGFFLKIMTENLLIQLRYSDSLAIS